MKRMLSVNEELPQDNEPVYQLVTTSTYHKEHNVVDFLISYKNVNPNSITYNDEIIVQENRMYLDSGIGFNQIK